MSEKMKLIQEVASKVGQSTDVVSDVVDELFLQLHQRFYQYTGINGDYIGEELRNEIDGRAFFHFLGMLEQFSTRYEWERGMAAEYLLHLENRDTLDQFNADMVGWNNSNGVKNI